MCMYSPDSVPKKKHIKTKSQEWLALAQMASPLSGLCREDFHFYLQVERADPSSCICPVNAPEVLRWAQHAH